MKEVYVIRHAEKAADGELTERGKQLANQLGSLLPKFASVTASNAPRTIETAVQITGIEPTKDDRAGFYTAAQDKSDDVNRLATESGITFFEAADIYNDPELLQGINTQAADLNKLIDDTFKSLSDGEAALIVSHDMTITPAMVLRGQPRKSIDYLSGYKLDDTGYLSPFSSS